MIVLDFIAPLLLLIPIGIYLYFIVTRIMTCLHKEIKKRWVILMTVLIILPAINVWGVWFLILLHLIAVNLLVELGNAVYQKQSKGNRNKVWILVYKSFLLPVLVTTLVFTYGAWNIRNVHQTNYEVATSKNIQDQGYRIALISDLHFENVINSSDIDDYVKKISSQKPDIVILAGDIVDEYTSYEGMKKVFESLSKIENRFGIFFVYGNHDYNNYGLLKFDEKELRKTIMQSGIRILEDSSTIINEDIVLIGRKDYSVGKRLPVEELYDGTNENKFVLLIDHQPVELQNNSRLGIDLQLSGHTHNGQIFPAGIVSELFGVTEMNYGYKEINQFKVIVSSGMVGWGYPVRTEGISEYVIIDLKPERNAG